MTILAQIASHRRPDGGPTSGAAGATDSGPTAACRSYIFIECAWLLYDLIIQITIYFKIFEYQGI